MEPMAQVLRRLPMMHDPNLLCGAEHSEDAGVYRLSDDLAIVLTTDFFPPLVDDPYVFGQIAAANSLSDVYAMGGEPLAVLNIVGFPDHQLDVSLLSEILRGGAEKVVEAGAVVAGGHSVRDAEIKYGLAVTGRIHPNAIVRNGGAQAGDVLVLTKPLGSGVLTTAAKKGLIPEEGLAEAIAVMCLLNRRARDAMVRAGVSAATDVTGFGLIGHAFEMAEASDVTLAIEAKSVPLMEGVYKLAGEGCVTRAHRSTLANVGQRLSAEGVDQTLLNVLADAQTSGGLLISVPRDRAAELIRACREPGANFAPPAIIGAVLPPSDARIRLS
jgi:selenide,water dikinase